MIAIYENNDESILDVIVVILSLMNCVFPIR